MINFSKKNGYFAIIFLLVSVILGISSCQKEQIADPEFPLVDYVFSGNVVDASSHYGIKGIMLTVSDGNGIMDTVITGDFGYYAIKISTIMQDRVFNFKAEDIDNNENLKYSLAQLKKNVPEADIKTCDCPTTPGQYEANFDIEMQRIKVEE